MSKRLSGCAAALATLLLCAVASAQPAPAAAPQDGRTRLSLRQAQSAYENLDLDEADRQLREAVRRCGRRNCSPGVLAQVHVLLGVVHVGGRQDAAAGTRDFVTALRLDASVEVDATLATPEIRAAFRRARRELRGGEGSPALHTPVLEQLANTPVPVYAQLSGEARAARAQVFYRLSGEGDWQSAELEAIGAGFGGEVPCSVVRTPGVEYYIELYAEGGALAGVAGSEEAPQHVSVVGARTGAAPYLPGRLPPSRCADAASTPGGLGATCTRDGECGAGLRCAEGTCAPRPADRTGAMPRLVVDLGLGVGLGFVDTVSNGTPPSYDEARFNDPANPDAGVTCGTLQCPLGPTGVAALPHAMLNIRVNVIPRFAIAGTMRVQFDFGSRTTLAPFLLSLRGYVALTSPGFTRRGLVVSVFAGTGVGQIQVRPASPRNLPGRATGHIITGLNNVHAGARVEYGLTDLWHVGGELTLQYMFPRTLFAADLQIVGGVHF